jgi:nucleotide-binding universal stress UspA family protein
VDSYWSASRVSRFASGTAVAPVRREDSHFSVAGLRPGVYDRVLFPTDASEAAAVATDHAIELSRRLDAPLHALYVVDSPSVQATDAYATTNYESTVEALEAEGRQRLGQLQDRAEREGLDVTSSLEEGTPASTIVEVADDGDVVVMGTHGRTGLDRYLIGSTTEKVVRTAEVPVVVIPLERNDADE